MSEGLTKKQMKDLRKLEKMQSKNLEQKNSNMKWIAIAIVSALFLAMFIAIIAVAKNKNKPVTSDGSAKFAQNGHDKMIGVTSTEATNSAKDSKQTLTLVEYADLQCPACRSYSPIVNQLLEAFPGQLKLTFKNFPLTNIHPNAMDAAIAAEAVNKQGKFFEYIDLLYEKQGEWAALPNPDDKFASYAKEVGVDTAKFTEDLKDPEIKKLIDDHRNEGIENGVSGTPTFFLNGERINTPPSIEEFKKLIVDTLSKNNNSGKLKSTQSPQNAVTTAPDQLPLQQ